MPKLNEHDRVLIRRSNSWVPGEVVNKHITPRSYVVRDEDGSVYRRNRVMLRKSYNKVEYKSNDDESLNDSNVQNKSSESTPEPI